MWADSLYEINEDVSVRSTYGIQVGKALIREVLMGQGLYAVAYEVKTYQACGHEHSVHGATIVQIQLKLAQLKRADITLLDYQDQEHQGCYPFVARPVIVGTAGQFCSKHTPELNGYKLLLLENVHKAARLFFGRVHYLDHPHNSLPGIELQVLLHSYFDISNEWLDPGEEIKAAVSFDVFFRIVGQVLCARKRVGYVLGWIPIPFLESDEFVDQDSARSVKCPKNDCTFGSLL